jgi:Mn-dependent DtxR family transcriptional regulator
VNAPARKLRPWAPSARQLEVLTAIRDLTAQLGWPPSIYELAEALGMSACRVRQHLDKLTARGLLRRGGYREQRALTLTDSGKRAIAKR